jgi:uncharacterized coiled-coil protein SlyX
LSTDAPYPSGLIERLGRVEIRQEHTETAVAALTATTAVHTEKFDGIKDDIRDLIAEIAKANERVTSILRAIWSLVLVLIPVAVGLIAIAINQ